MWVFTKLTLEGKGLKSMINPLSPNIHKKRGKNGGGLISGSLRQHMSMTVNPPYLHQQLPYDSISNTQSHLLCANFTGWCGHILGHHLKRHLSQFLRNDTKAHRFGFTATHTDVKRGIGEYPVVQRLFQAQANLFCQRNKPLTLTMQK